MNNETVGPIVVLFLVGIPVAFLLIALCVWSDRKKGKSSK